MRQRKNPFVLDIYSHLFVGYEEQKRELLSALNANEKYILLIGNIGVGKTTMVKWVLNKYGGVYVPRPPKELSRIKHSFLPSLFSRIFKFLNVTSHKIIVIDEFHEAEKEFIEDLRSYLDQLHNISSIFVITPDYEEYLKQQYSSLYSRITTKVYLNNLSHNEVFQLVKSRIKMFGGSGIEPFTSDAIEKIYSISGGNPREVLKLCSKYYKISIERNIEVIDSSLISQYEDTSSLDFMNHKPFNNYKKQTKEIFSESHNPNKQKREEITLTPKQKEIVKLIKQYGGLSPPDLVNLIDKKDYASELHALRGVNNILRKLENEGILFRKKQGRRYIYYLKEGSLNLNIL